MTKHQHTPGPWEIKQGVLKQVGPTGKHLFGLTEYAGLGYEADLNLSLIAAAPDLLAALKAMVDRWEPDCEGTDRIMWENAQAAIAKATGA